MAKLSVKRRAQCKTCLIFGGVRCRGVKEEEIQGWCPFYKDKRKLSYVEIAAYEVGCRKGFTPTECDDDCCNCKFDDCIKPSHKLRSNVNPLERRGKNGKG